MFRDLLIRVTSFFRDKETFRHLRSSWPFPHLFAGKQADSAVRVWVPGCATGEEAYSLAILLREHMDHLTGVPKVQVFATDIDESAIATARLGRYPIDPSAGPLHRAFRTLLQAVPGGFVVSKEIRDLCTFSAHNVVRDPPFSRMDLVSCRNLLIYMETDLQAAVIPAFHYSLLPGGILLLGGAESTAKHEDLFVPLDKAARISSSVGTSRSPPLKYRSWPSSRRLLAALRVGNIPVACDRAVIRNRTESTICRSPHPTRPCYQPPLISILRRRLTTIDRSPHQRSPETGYRHSHLRLLI